VIYGVTFTGDVTGSVNATANDDGRGVKYSINVSGFNGKIGPFPWHIHEHKVEGGDCKTALAHQNLNHVDPEKKCDTNAPETCENGDMSGKHGKISALMYGGFLNYAAQFVDLYTSTNSDHPAYIGNLSIVIHLPDKSRLACANFALVSGNASKPGEDFSLSTSTATSQFNATSTKTPPYPTTTESNTNSSETSSLVYNTPTSPPSPDNSNARNETTSDPYSGASLSYAVSGVLAFGGFLAGLFLAL
jgi:hypothetical protein